MEQILQLVLLILLILVALLLLTSGIFSIICQYKAHKNNKEVDDLLEKICGEIVNEIMQEATKEKTKEETQPTVDYNSMTINELKDMAKSRNIKGYYRMKKDELIKVLNK